MAARPCSHRLSLESAGLWLGRVLAVLQSASLFGAYGLSFLTILLGASLAEFCAAPRRIAAPALMLVLFAGLWGYGALRLAGAARRTRCPAWRLRLVQPDVPQREKYVRRYVPRNWQRLLDLSSARRAIPPISSGRKRRRLSCSTARPSRWTRSRR